MRNTKRSTPWWSVLLGLLAAILLGIAAPAMATLQNPLTVGAQTGVLTVGTPGTASFAVTVNRTNATPASATLNVTSALPTGATSSLWSLATGGSLLSNPVTLSAPATTVYLRITTTAATPAFSGPLTVQASATGSTTRTGSSTLAVKNNQSITFNPLASRIFGEPDFVVSATTTSNLAATFSATGNCSVAGSTVHLTGAGSCTVTASQAGNATYNAATPVAQTFSIAQGNQSINFGALPPKTVFDADFSLTATATSGLPVSLSSTTTSICTVAGTLVHLTQTAGDCTITASQAGSVNYLAATSVAQTFSVTVVTGAIELYAVTGSTTLPAAGGEVVNVWGYNTSNAPVSQPGGPTLVVNQGDVVRIVLHNQLTENTALLIQGQAMPPDTTGAAPGGGRLYTFTATQPGSYLYEAGLVPNAQHQVAMGLYGALVVRPTSDGTSAGTPILNQAYAPSATAFDTEAVLLLSEIDPALNADPAAFDMRTFAPKYFLINGKVYPDTDAIASAASGKVLLRYLNAGVKHHSMAVLGLRQNFVAKDGSLLPTLNHNVVAETLAPGQTGDAIATVPAAASTASKFAVYDASLSLHNNGADNAFGGMLTFVTAGTGSSSTGPTTSGVSMTPNPTNGTVSVVLAATLSSGATAAEYFIDSPGANGSGVPMTGTTAPAATIAAATVAALPSGNHTIYVHGTNGTTWGAFNSATLNLDKAGPITTALALSPNPSNGTAAVVLNATGNDTSSGGSKVTTAEYFIGTTGATGTGIQMLPNFAATVASFTATINPSPAAGGVVSVRSKDELGNWGDFATIVMSKVANGPVTSALSVSPPANNGSYGVNSSNPVVRVTATITSASSTIAAAAEGFIDAVAAPGSGFVFVPTDGQWNSATETVSADIPLANINLLTNGTHTISVRGRDAVGNWGNVATINYLIDRAAPTFTGISLAPSPTYGAATVTLTVNGFSDPLVGGLASGVGGGEYWIASDPGVGAGVPFTGLTASIPVSTLTPGTYTIGARVRDAAGNWSTVTRTAQVVVVPDLIFSNGFQAGNRNSSWGWTSVNDGQGTNLTRVNVTAAAALVGTLGLQVQGNNSNYVQYDFGTAAQPATATYDARFYFRPNGNASAGNDILVAASSNSFNTTRFRIRYRLNGTTPQVQIQLGTSNTNTVWTNILGGTSNNVIEVVSSGGTLQLYVNGTLAQTLTTTSNMTVGAIRLGSVTSGGSATLMYFDAFASKRSVSPLIGP